MPRLSLTEMANQTTGVQLTQTRRMVLMLVGLAIIMFSLFALIASDTDKWSRHLETLSDKWQYAVPNRPSRIVPHCTGLESEPTIMLGDLPGFLVLDNLWFHEDTFYLFAEKPEDMPDKDRAMSGPFGWEVRPFEDMPLLFERNQSICLEGSSLLLVDHPQWGEDGQYTGYSHYYHLFGEGFMGALAALEAAVEPIVDQSRPELGESLWPQPYLNTTIDSRFRSEEYTWAHGKAHHGVEFDRMVIPWISDWRDSHGINSFLFNHIYGKTTVEAAEWEEWREEGLWVSMRRVVIADRWAAARYSPPVEGWYRQALSALSLPFSHLFFERTRAKLLNSLEIPALLRPSLGKSLRKIPKILYVSRQSSNRKFTEQTHNALMDVLSHFEETGKAKIDYVKWEGLSKKSQVKMSSDADIYLGVHGNGMTHQLWMPPGGKVVECFPLDTFTRDYQIIAEFLGHDHHLIWGNRVVPQTEWDEGQAGDYSSIWSGRPIPLDVDFMRNLLQNLLNEMIL
ncbi:hypothetical protein BD324DRAFT_684385 [Kockovaella imperatae]|uniref:Glycosyltransferase 61 catalytic domain-containing protein n=1 Tax=Kockovaella imperatae TaxID=4999 RepID=A0A1Y1U5D4_9TREE|nr:hypothetical protein BD324DRAFT_684385 [Kockovaella imperatae]ORX33241.1 hypothetical protein BD324DRAFT_684385 [Kockovaella imperatae]